MKKFVIFLLSAMLLWNCEETELLNETGRLQVTDINLPALPDGYNYKAWLLVDGSYVLAGTINNDSIANGHARFSTIEATDLSIAQSFAITVETNNSIAPSDYVLLIGDFNGNTAELSPNAVSLNGIQSLGSMISASYTVQNATVPTGQQNEYTENGIWFFKGEGTETETTLHLKYNGIRYQAWLHTEFQNAERYLNMGRINSDTLADDWKNFTLFPENTPSFAGEDFLSAYDGGETYPPGFLPWDVKSSKLIITPTHTNFVNNSIPFPIHLLEATVPANAVKNPNTTYEMQLNTNFGAKATKL